MILLQIKRIKQLKPVESEGIEQLQTGQKFVQFSGNHPNNPQKGSVSLCVKRLKGQFEDVEQVFFIGDYPIEQGRLVNYKKQLLGDFTIEITLDTIYAHGLAYSVDSFIQNGGLIIGLTQAERESLNSIDTQRDSLGLLAEFIIPSKKDIILNFAKVAFLCHPSESNQACESHFLGSPKHNKSTIQDSNQNELFHLSTLCLTDFPVNESWINDLEYLSFYLKISETNQGWPQDKADFNVLTSKKKSIDQQDNSEQTTFFTVQPLLDIPVFDHSLIYYHQFSPEEINSYEELRAVYMHLLFGDKVDDEFNKFLGYPDSIQNCVAYEAERIYNKRDYSPEIQNDAINWRLLLQVSPYCKWFKFFDEFGDGTIYFMIRQKDLESGDFSKCQLVVQNT